MMIRWLMSTLGVMCAAGLALAQPRVVINEFAYDDTGDDNLEFIELYNAEQEPVNISGWIVDCGDQLTGDNNLDFTIPPGTILQPGQYYVIGTPALNTRCGGCVNQIFDPGSAGRIENDNEWIALIIPGEPRVVVDAVVYEANRSALSSWVPADIIPQ
jgi:signal peptidase I